MRRAGRQRTVASKCLRLRQGGTGVVYYSLDDKTGKCPSGTTRGRSHHRWAVRRKQKGTDLTGTVWEEDRDLDTLPGCFDTGKIRNWVELGRQVLRQSCQE